MCGVCIQHPRVGWRIVPTRPPARARDVSRSRAPQPAQRPSLIATIQQHRLAPLTWDGRAIANTELLYKRGAPENQAETKGP